MTDATGAPLYVDQTHLGRAVTGIERITLELFSAAALRPLAPIAIPGGRGTARMMADQQVTLPALLVKNPKALVLTPGFPPSIPLVLAGGARVVPYIHDCFLITRPQDLNWRAKAYMAPAFRFAVRRLPWMLVNSEATAADLRRFARADAEITCYRPIVRDIFGAAPFAARAAANRRVATHGRLDILALGTVEPRKNLSAAADIVAALRAAHGLEATLHIVGRVGWGGEGERLEGRPGVILHGYQDADRVRELLSQSHLVLSTSHDEGLGLPLIEAQHAGLAVAAPDRPVFREVLAGSGLLIEPSDARASAARIADFVARPDAFRQAAEEAAANVARWNATAERDRAALVARLHARLGA